MRKGALTPLNHSPTHDTASPPAHTAPPPHSSECENILPLFASDFATADFWRRRYEPEVAEGIVYDWYDLSFGIFSESVLRRELALEPGSWVLQARRATAQTAQQNSPKPTRNFWNLFCQNVLASLTARPVPVLAARATRRLAAATATGRGRSRLRVSALSRRTSTLASSCVGRSVSRDHIPFLSCIPCCWH